MNKRLSWIVAILSICSVAAMIVALIANWTGGTSVYGNLGLLEITGTSPGRNTTARFHSDGKTATVRLGEHTAHIEPNQVTLPGGRTVWIPPSCKRLELRAFATGMTVALDGVEVE